MQHFKYLLKLGEVRATHVMAPMLVDRVTGCENQSEVVSMAYLPILMGFRYCYMRYMAGFECKVRSNAKVATIIKGVEGNIVDKTQFVSMST